MCRKRFFRRLQSAVFLLFFIFTAAGCSYSADALICAPERVFMVYLNGSDLESDYGAASADIAEMLAAGERAGRTVYIYTGGTRVWHTKGIEADRNQLFRLENGRLREVAESESLNMGLGSTLASFVLYCMRETEASAYELILWNHGGSALTGFGKDENEGNDTLLLPEIAAALSEIYASGGKRLETLAFDACLMASAEAYAAVSPWCDYLVASEDLMPADGFDYLTFFRREGSVYGENAGVAKALAETYAASQKKNSSGMVTVSVLDCAAAPRLRASFDAACALLPAAGLPDNPRLLTVLGGAGTAEGYDNTADLLTVFEAYSLTGSAEYAALAAAVKAAVIYRGGVANTAALCGLNICYPARFYPQMMRDMAAYRSLGFSDVYAGVVEGAARARFAAGKDSGCDAEDFNINSEYCSGEYCGENLFYIYYSAAFYEDDRCAKTYRIKKSRFSDDAEITAICVSTVTKSGRHSGKYQPAP